MVKLRKITEAVDSSHTSIMYNLADTLKKKGIEATYAGDKGIKIDFTLTTDNDPNNTKEGKAWIKSDDNKGKALVFKGDGLKGQFYWDIIKGNDGKRLLLTKDVSVKGEKNLTVLQKKLKADTPKEGKLTGRSAQLFTYPEPYPITNLVSPTFQSYLRKLYSKIISDVSMALSEVVELPVEAKKECYFIDYDENFNRVNEGYITEADDKEEKKISWKDDDVQKAITDTIKGLEIDKSKTTNKELIFTHNGKNGSLHLQGYMLVLDTDTDDDIPATSYPVKDKNNLTLDNLLETIKTVFSRRESINIDNSDKEETKEVKKEEHMWDDDIQSDEDPRVDENLDAYLVVSGYVEVAPDGVWDTYDTVEGDINGYATKDKAIAVATDLYNKNNKLYGVTELVDGDVLSNDTFWDEFDDGKINLIWDSHKIEPKEDYYEEEPVEEKRLDEEVEKEESVEDHIEYHESTIDNSPVFQDVAKERFMDKLFKSLNIAPTFKGECNILGDCNDCDVVWLYLSPSYAINQLSNIVLPLCISGRKITMPVVDIPDPNAVFGGDFTENTMADYDNAVQDYYLNDAPLSDIGILDLDNADDIKASVVDFVNNMAEDYQNKKDTLADSLDLKGESLLKESRYYIVPSDTDLSSSKEVTKITPLGFTDLSIAQNEMKELSDSGRYNFDLKILDTNFSNNKEKWTFV